MKIRNLLLCACFALTTIGLLAQTTVTTSGGTTGSVPLFTGTSTVGNSIVTQAASDIGIGDTTPITTFTVMAGDNGTDDMPMYAGYNTTTANAGVVLGKAPYFEIIGNGNANQGPSIGLLQVGIGSTTANTYQAPASIYLGATNATTASGAGTAPVTNGNILGKIEFDGDDGNSVRAQGAVIDAEVDTAHEAVSTGIIPTALNLVSFGEAPIVFYTEMGSGSVGPYLGGLDERMRIAYNGDVGIGTATPTAKLDVAGNIQISGTGAGITFPNGSIQTVAYTGVACGGDYAEQVNVTGDRKHFVPGDVLVVDPKHPGQFLKSATPYSTAVAGVYSTKPGYVGHAVGMPKTKNQVPMAMLGIVPTYVTAANGPIHPGDLLVTSSKIGYAMKATDRSRLTGAVIGKALGNLNSGTGKIEVLVTLQ